ncbi:ABC transporter ATP-binding protein [Chitinibacteraceae bacterium HSL-7]
MGALAIRGVTKTFGQTTILKGIDISVDAGDFLILVGPSGCGKSTLMNIIAGLESPTSGEVAIGERVVNHVAPKDRDIAMVFQSYALYPTMSVRENIAFGLETRGVPRPQQDETIARVAKMLQIDHLLDRKPAQLSGGQRQRVAMGRALARDPKLFLFDEPLSNLDAKLRVEMRAEIKKLHQRLKTTVVYVTHDQIEAMTLGNRIAVMKDGVIQQFGSPAEIYQRPANTFVAGFIGSPSMNFIPASVMERAGVRGIELTGQGGVYFAALDAGCNLDVGRSVLLGLRPEQFAVSGEGLLCAVVMTEPTGPDTMVFSTINGRDVVIRLAPAQVPADGAPLVVTPDMNKAVLFDPDSGIRLA